MWDFVRPRSRKRPAGRARPGLEALEDRCVPSNSAAFLGADTTTQGSWRGAYGGGGYAIVGDATKLPGNVSVTASGSSTYVYADPTDNLRGLQVPGDPSTRVEAGWFNYVYGTPTTSFTVEVRVPGGNAGTRVSFYVEDWDGGGRAETVTALDSQTGATLGTESVSDFRNGVYLSWNVTGDVVFRFTKTAGPSAEVSAVFFGGASNTPKAGGSAAFVGEDDTTNGNWQGVYGAQGYDVFGAPSRLPTYANVSIYGDSVGPYLFAASTADPRGLQNPSGGRVVAAESSQAGFTLDLNLTDHRTHQVTLYAVDWDNMGRSERFDVYDNTTGALLGSQTISNFSAAGEYLSWNVKGHVQIRVTSLSGTGASAVVEGVFFDRKDQNGSAFAPSATGLMNGGDVALIDRLFMSGRHHSDGDPGGPGLPGDLD